MMTAARAAARAALDATRVYTRAAAAARAARAEVLRTKAAAARAARAARAEAARTGDDTPPPYASGYVACADCGERYYSTDYNECPTCGSGWCDEI
jgi:hypothetical protein